MKEWINVYEVSEFLWCPRRYYYIKKSGLNPSNYFLEEGNRLHKNKDKALNNVYFENKKLRLKGKVDYLTARDKIILYELKKGRYKKLYKNHKYQLMAYWYLAKYNGLRVSTGLVKYDKGKSFKITYESKEEEKLKKIIREMRNLKKLPDKCKNKKRCNGCNLKDYCWS